MYFIMLIVFMGVVSSDNALNLRGRDSTLERIVNLGNNQPAPIEESWIPNTRGQFMRDILFGIHPDSPRNREFWEKSGYNWNRPQNMRNIYLPSVQQRAPEQTQLKIKRPLRRKLPVSPSATSTAIKRLPKLIEPEGNLAKGNSNNPKTLINNKPLEKGLLPTPIPLAINTEERGHAETKKFPTKCFVSTTVPVIYYLLPYPPTPLQSLQGVNPVPQQQQTNIFSSGSYAPIQNRLPFPPQPQVLYFQPVPLDLLAMDNVEAAVRQIDPKLGTTEKYQNTPKPDESLSISLNPTPSTTISSITLPKGETTMKYQGNASSGLEITDHELFRQEILPVVLPLTKTAEKTTGTKIPAASETKTVSVSKDDNGTQVSDIEIFLEKEILGEEDGQKYQKGSDLSNITTENPTTPVEVVLLK